MPKLIRVSLEKKRSLCNNYTMPITLRSGALLEPPKVHSIRTGCAKIKLWWRLHATARSSVYWQMQSPYSYSLVRFFSLWNARLKKYLRHNFWYILYFTAASRRLYSTAKLCAHNNNDGPKCKANDLGIRNTPFYKRQTSQKITATVSADCFRCELVLKLWWHCNYILFC